jgi:hypothetical protein
MNSCTDSSMGIYFDKLQYFPSINHQHRWFSGKISRCHLFQINSASPGFDSRPMQSFLFAVLELVAMLWCGVQWRAGEC